MTRVAGRMLRFFLVWVLVASAPGIALAQQDGASTFEEYAARVAAAQELARDKSGLVEDESSAAEVAAEIADLLPGTEPVEFDDRVIDVDNSVLTARLAELATAETAEEREESLGQIDEHLTSLRAAVGAPGAEPIREDREVLESLIGEERAEPGFATELLRRALEWIQNLLAGLQFEQTEGGALLVNIVLWTTGALLALVVIWLVRRAVAARRRREGRFPGFDEQAEEEAIVPAAEGLPVDALAYAEQLAAESRFRDAVRVLFGDAARVLVRHGLVRQTKTMTNGELLRAVRRASGGAHRPLTSLAGDFDQAWYGHVDPGRAGYDRARERYRDVLNEARVFGPGAGGEAA